MSAKVPTVLIFGHSFLKRMQHDLLSQFDQRADKNFKLQGTASVYLHGVGGRTVVKLRSFDLHVVEQIAPEVIILEIGTNDLVNTGPEVVGSNIAWTKDISSLASRNRTREFLVIRFHFFD